jgi:hypothetical protein
MKSGVQFFVVVFEAFRLVGGAAVGEGCTGGDPSIYQGDSDTDCANGFCLGADLLDGGRVCGSVGDYGGGCSDDAGCGHSSLVCMDDGKCALDHGVICAMAPNAANDGNGAFADSMWGGETLFCKAQFCIHPEVSGSMPMCGSIGEFGVACSDDADCVSDISLECVEGTCVKSLGAACSSLPDPWATDFLSYKLTSLGGETLACKGGFCLSDLVVGGQPVCGTVADKGPGCTEDADCVGLTTCIDDQCLIAGGGDCSSFSSELNPCEFGPATCIGDVCSTSSEPTAEPTDEPTEEPTAEPTEEPTAEPTTAEPTAEPTDEPTTAEPTDEPTTAEPTAEPTDEPTTGEPTDEPTTAEFNTAPLAAMMEPFALLALSSAVVLM